jgi:hypothetical protein
VGKAGFAFRHSYSFQRRYCCEQDAAPLWLAILRVDELINLLQQSSGFNPPDLQSASRCPAARRGNSQTVAIVDAMTTQC